MLCAFVSSAFGTELILHAKTTKGVPTEQVFVGEPFWIEVVVIGGDKVLKGPSIANLSREMILETGVNHTIRPSSNMHETQYKYLVRFDQPDIITLGPAAVLTEQGIVKSAKLMLTIKKNDSLGAHRAPAFIAELMLDKEKIMLGEKISYRLRLYYDAHHAHIQSAHPANFPGDSQDFVGTAGEEMRQGKRYAFIEWKGAWYPEKTGTLSIPPVRIDYQLHDETLFGQFFAKNDYQHVYTNRATITVDPLPPSKEPLQAVGHITAFSARISPEEGNIGDALVLELELVGSGNFEKIKTPQLQLPKSLTFYESERNVTEKNAETTCRFSFIVQGLQEGTWEIPGQSFTYFDTQTRHIVTLTTVPLSVTIRSVPSSVAMSPVAYDEPILDISDTKKPTGYSLWNWWLPWKLFVALMLFPLVGLLIYGLWLLWLFYQAYYEYPWYKKRAMQRALRMLQRKGQQYPSHIYGILLHFFAELDRKNPALYTASDVECYAQRVLLAEAIAQDWKLFWQRVLAVRFGPQDMYDTAMLYDQTAQWIAIFGKQR